MAKQTGITAVVTIGDAGGTARTISGDVTDFTINQSRALIDTTGVDKDYMERLTGLGDYSIGLSGILNVASGQAHSVFSSMGTAQRAWTLSFSAGGTANGTAVISTYTVGREAGGRAPFTAQLECANGTGIVWS